MEEKLQKEEGISLLEILHLLLSKLKLLILVVIVGGLLGGSFAVWRTYDVNYYGTEIQFYVNPDKKDSETVGSQFGVYGAYGRHVMDNMVKLLSSESFTEQLILDSKIVPNTRDWTSTDENVTDESLTAELNGYIQAINDDSTDENGEYAMGSQLRANAKKAAATVAQSKTEKNLLALQDAWSKAVPVITLDGGKTLGTSYWSYSETNYLVLNNQGLLPDSVITAYTDYNTSQELSETLTEEAKIAVTALEENTEAALDLWRTTAEYKANLSRYSGQISFSYLGESDDFDDANNLARSFIYVKISVLNNQEFAKTLREKIIRVLPAYVETHMAIPDGYEGTNCQRITRTDDIHLTNVHYTTKEAIKYAVLFALAAAIVACVVIIINDKSDKRLRDQETITRLFNIPVLGIVPTIEDLKDESIAKKKRAYANPKIQPKVVEEGTSQKENSVAEEAAVAVVPEAAETSVPVKKANAEPKKRRDTSNSPSNKKKAANKSKSEVK